MKEKSLTSAFPPALLLAFLIALALSSSPAAGKAPLAKVVISNVTVKGKKVTVTGKVVPPASTSNAKPANASVALTLSGAGKPESFSAKPDSKWRFKATRTTKLTGQLTVSARARVAGKLVGKQARKRFRGPQAEVPVGPPPPSAAGPYPCVAPLNGTFRFDEGVSGPGGATTGTYFRMIDPGGGYLINGDSRAKDQTYTLLRPGTDGGLRTDIYQPRSNPMFDGSGVLSKRVTQRELFFGSYFTIFTEPTDFAAPYAPIPLPRIDCLDGKLSGQVTAWVANWNKELLFNQGTPKPDGTLPGSTKPLTGSYDPATRRYVVEWTSLIVGGPFAGFGGYWHLEGTFEPAA